MDNTTNLERQVGSEDKRVEFSVGVSKKTEKPNKPRKPRKK